MGTRLPSAGAVAAFALVAGLLLGAGSAMLDAATRPWRIGDFAPDALAVRPHTLPRVEVPETVHRFGSLGVGATGQHEFVIINVGPAPLTLTQGATSCTCTFSGFESSGTATAAATRVVAPGETTRVKVQWQAKTDGPFRQQAMILTDDPRRPEIALVVEGFAIPRWKAVPPAIVLPMLSGDGETRATARIFTYGTEPPLVESLATPDPQAAPFIHLSSSPLSADEVAAEPGATGGFLLTVEVRPGLPRGPFRQAARLEFRMPDPVTAELPVEGLVAGDLALAGGAWDSSYRAISLGTVSGRSGFRTELFLTAKGPHRASLRPVVREVVPRSLVVEVGAGVPIGGGSVLRFPVTITIPPGSPGCNHLCSQQARGGRIVMETGHPDEPTLTIPVCVAISP